MPEPFVAQLGRISGKLLASNLLRDGVELTFRNGPLDTDLLYLDVADSQLGINTVPTVALDVLGNGKISDSLIVDGTQAKIDNLKINTDGSFGSTVGPIIIEPTGVDAYIRYGKILNSDLEIKDNYLQVTTANTDLVLGANGTGSVDLQSSTAINGNLDIFNGGFEATGNVTLKGKFFIGDSPLDTVTIAPDFKQSIIPGTTLTYDLGSSGKRWDNVYLTELSFVSSVTTTSVTISEQTLFTGNTISTLQSNENLVLDSDSGNIVLESLNFNQGTITNLTSTPVTLSHTGTGYLHLVDESGFGIPSGDTSERVGAEVGETRWNNEIGYMECFDGSVWQVATGGGSVVTQAVMEDFGNIYTLIFG